MAMAVNPITMQLVVEELSDGSQPSQEWTIEVLYHSKDCGTDFSFEKDQLERDYECYKAQMGASELPTTKTFALQNTGNGLMASVGNGKADWNNWNDSQH